MGFSNLNLFFYKYYNTVLIKYQEISIWSRQVNLKKQFFIIYIEEKISG